MFYIFSVKRRKGKKFKHIIGKGERLRTMTFIGKIMPQVVSANAKPYQLSPEQLQFYWDNGYLMIKELFDSSMLNIFRERFIEIANTPDASHSYSIVKDPKLVRLNVKPEMYINKIQELLYDPVFSQYSEDPALLRIVSHIVGEDITAVNCMLINKPPGTQSHPPHQDLYYFPFRPADKIIASWTAIDPVHVGNGCLYVVPGSHKIESLYVHGETSTDKKQFYHGIARKEVAAPSRRLHLEMSPGDTVLFHPYLVHGSGENSSQHYRKAMTAHYANSSCHYIDVRGTPQEVIASVMETEIRRRGLEFDFVDLWRMKSKQVKGMRSNL